MAVLQPVDGPRDLHGPRTAGRFAFVTVTVAVALGVGIDRLTVGLELPTLHALDASLGGVA